MAYFARRTPPHKHLSWFSIRPTRRRQCWCGVTPLPTPRSPRATQAPPGYKILESCTSLETHEDMQNLIGKQILHAWETRTGRDGSREGCMSATSTREISLVPPLPISLCDTLTRWQLASRRRWLLQSVRWRMSWQAGHMVRRSGGWWLWRITRELVWGRPLCVRAKQLASF